MKKNIFIIGENSFIAKNYIINSQFKKNVKKILLPTVIGPNDLNFKRLIPYLLKQINIIYL